ncbi:polymeric immunoglobulin receptor-like isoform X2 [Sphaeramia orbicularis]|uniref:polymeric immunoglobulin receptor-like isoform X2 n=1 Tax=Sphaeramia orbicularis TaxID=375764 RepID=UPI00117FBECF|nr:polymeric immunoglobulin receptor-like isoform X2 [Sphaeramia orbicularis]
MFFEAFLFLLRSNAQMWRFQKLLFTFCFVLDSDIGAAQLIDVSGYEGRNVNISCSYEYGYDTYEKYLCRNDCGDADVLITTTEVQKNRYSITDDTSVRVFTVTISQLSAADAGKYWCGISKSFTDIYTEVKLNVKPDSCCDSVTIIQSSLENSVSISCPYKSEFLNSLKYICRGKQPSVCLQQAVVTSVNKLNRRFGLQDDKTSRHFTVTVTDVTKDDAGSYLCGVQRNNHLDEFNHIQLEVKDWCCVKLQEVSGSVGQPVTLQCPYPPQHVSNRKFLCKGERRRSCRNVVESQSQTDDRFTLQDNTASSSFSVTIVKLEVSDAGTYWCGSDSEWSLGNYTKIQLSVVVGAPASAQEPKLPSHFNQLLWGNPEVFPGQLRETIPLACPGSALRSPPRWTYPRSIQEASSLDAQST